MISFGRPLALLPPVLVLDLPHGFPYLLPAEVGTPIGFGAMLRNLVAHQATVSYKSDEKMDQPSADKPVSSPLYLAAAIASFIIGGLFAFFGRAIGIKDPSVLVAIALIGAGLQAVVLILWYLHLTRPKPTVQHWFAKPNAGESAPQKHWPD